MNILLAKHTGEPPPSERRGEGNMWLGIEIWKRVFGSCGNGTVNVNGIVECKSVQLPIIQHPTYLLCVSAYCKTIVALALTCAAVMQLRRWLTSPAFQRVKRKGGCIVYCSMSVDSFDYLMSERNVVGFRTLSYQEIINYRHSRSAVLVLMIRTKANNGRLSIKSTDGTKEGNPIIFYTYFFLEYQ